MGEPSTKKRTPATATLSDAVAATETKLKTVDPPAGEVTATAGGVVSPPPPPPTAEFMSVVISAALSARLYTRNSSIRPWKYSFHTPLPPMRSAPVEVAIGPPTA